MTVYDILQVPFCVSQAYEYYINHAITLVTFSIQTILDGFGICVISIQCLSGFIIHLQSFILEVDMIIF